MQFEIFRAGKRADNNGNTITISPDDVAKIASHYDTTKHEAPIVIGHPTTNAPAFGWVKSLTAKNGVLLADFSEMDEDFVELVKKGRYKKVSASFYPPQHANNPDPNGFYLRHVGFLGAQPPAVKGLSAINFSDDENGVLSFGETEWVLSRVLRNLREWIIGKDGIETANQIIPDWHIDDLKNLMDDTPEPIPQFSEPNPKDNPTIMNPTENEKLAIARAEKAEAELNQLKAQQAQAQRNQDHTQNVDFAETLIKKGNIKPADKDLIVQILDFAEHPNDTTVDFGEGKSLSGSLKTFLQGLNPILPTGETATAARAGVANTANTGLSADFAESANPEALSHHERALALIKQENISYHDAARRTAQ